MTPRPYMRRRQANQMAAMMRESARTPVLDADREQLRAVIADTLAGRIGVNPTACPKCGKSLKPKGRHFHIRKCHGNPR